MSTKSQWDAIVIGSGMGGLTAASLLAQLKGRRVLVLERNKKLGGYTHTFKRAARFKWDAGVHYVGDMQLGNPVRRAMDRVTGGAVKWAPMPDAYDVFHFPEFQVRYRSGREGFRAGLLEVFPGEGPAIDLYLSAIDAVVSVMGLVFFDSIGPAWLARGLRHLPLRGMRLARQTTAEVLDSVTSNLRLRAALAGQWGDYGLPPSQSSFLMHAAIAKHYLGGAFYPEGGSDGLASSVKAIVEKSGGETRVAAPVDRIVVENGRAVGVQVNGQELRAPLIFSDAGARNTFLKLLPREAGWPYRSELEKIPPGFGLISLFVGLKSHPRSFGVEGENRWVFTSDDHDEMFSRRSEAFEGRPTFVCATFPSAKDPSSVEHTATLMTAVDASMFDAWRDQPVKRRGEAYETVKKRMVEGVLALMEKSVPGFRDQVEFAEISTPLTNQHYVGHPQGEVYGLPGTPERFFSPWARPRTTVPGLYLCGADAQMHGVAGALMGGVMAVAAAEGVGVLGKIFRSHSS